VCACVQCEHNFKKILNDVLFQHCFIPDLILERQVKEAVELFDKLEAEGTVFAHLYHFHITKQVNKFHWQLRITY